MFVYCLNNPINFSDNIGTRCVAANPIAGGHAYNQADITIVNIRDNIIKAAEQYNIDKNVLAACIYVEQYYNYDLIDVITDVPLFFLDTSVGVAQVKISTAKLVAENGYVPAYGNGMLQNLQIATRLQNDDAYNIQCAAAYLSYLADCWDAVYDVSSDPAVWGTLYNKGVGIPHGSLGPNFFGERVSGYYWYMELLLQ